MRFGPVPTAVAAGAILAHATQGLAEGGKPVRLRKGVLLTDADCAALVRAGHGTVIVARLAADDVHEDVAATRLAQALVPDLDAAGLQLTRAGTGRVNVLAASAGVARIAAATIARFNQVDPMITVATVPDMHRMEQGGMVATIKIIAYAVPEAAVQAAAASGAGLSLARPVHRTATLIETTLAPGDPVPDKGRRAMALRLQRLGASLTPRVIVRHATADIAAAVAAAPGDIVMVLTASATSDPRDVGPEAVRVAGGSITRFGMPVDPGNLLFTGQVQDKHVIGLPGCARSPVLNGADWILERVICGIAVSDADIAAMGVGGLLKESPARLHPRRKG